MAELIGMEPVAADIVLISGDTLSTLLVTGEDVNADGTLRPADFTGTICAMQVRPAARSSQVFLDLDDSYFILGQSQEAIDWDIAEGNVPGTSKDQIFVVVHPPLTVIIPGEWEYDLELTGPGPDVKTTIKGVFEVLEDVTR